MSFFKNILNSNYTVSDLHVLSKLMPFVSITNQLYIMNALITHLINLLMIAINILCSVCRDPSETSIEPVYCKLCKKEVIGILNLRSHLCSQQHKAKQQEIDTTECGQDLKSLLSQLGMQ